MANQTLQKCSGKRSLDSPGAPEVITGVLPRGRHEGQCERGEAEVGMKRFEDGGWGHQPRDQATSRSWKKQRNILPGAFRRNTALLTP